MALHADLILRSGRIATMARDRRTVSALAAHRGHIVALGADHEIADLGGPGTRVVDLQGRTVVPGIVDSHAHPDSYAIRLAKWHRVGPEAIATRDELLALIDRTTKAGASDRWFAGYRFDDRKTGGYPTQVELDRAGNGRPVYILRTDGHLALANSAAFAACGIGGNAEDPPFGRFDR
ncbi:MAG: amidohydrolase family protein, partial [Alphaproteobacteria bacterium]|nr:amidohydrolase family protein [Alphaproteobacteria bacterium]